MNTLSFTLPEILSLLGLAQCVYLLVHILVRARKIRRVLLPALFFAVLATAFWTDAMQRHIDLAGGGLAYLQWVAWYLGPPLSVLLIIQMAEDRFPSAKDFWVLLLLPLSFLLSATTLETPLGACGLAQPCDDFLSILDLTGLMAGTISLLVIFSKRDLFKNIRRQKFGTERYWLVLSLIVLNTLFLGSVFLEMASSLVSESDRIILRTIFGLGFAYLVSTSLLRIFPSSQKAASSSITSNDLNDEEKALAGKIEGLLDFEKVYHEPTYARSDLARECGVSEMMVSKVINVHFQKSFPQIMNERRIEDAKRLLKETDAAVKTVAEEVGFNSLPSFNRVFKDMTGVSPGEYRRAK